MVFGGVVVVVHKAYFLIFNNLIGPCQEKIFYFQHGNRKKRAGRAREAKAAETAREAERAESIGGCALALFVNTN